MGLAYNIAVCDVEGVAAKNHPKYKIYKAWYDMIGRCYSPRLQEKWPTYAGVTVCAEWLTFSNFLPWATARYFTGAQLDKDVRYPGNKIYSPSTCEFVSRQINTLLVLSGARRGKHPLGVNMRSGERAKPYQTSAVVEGRQKTLGYFASAQEAHTRYLRAKVESINRAIDGELSYSLKNGLRRWAYMLQQHVDNQTEFNPGDL